MAWTESEGSRRILPQAKIAALAPGIAARPDSAELRAELGDALAATERHAEALDALETARTLDPAGFAHWPVLIDCLTRLRRYDDALALCTRHPRPGDGDWVREHGILLLKLKRHDEARVQLRRALDLGDPSLKALAALLTSWSRRGDGGGLLAESDALDPRYRDTACARGFRAIGHSLLGQTGAARALVDLDRNVMRVRVEVPPGYPDLPAFNRALAGEIARIPPATIREGARFNYGARTQGLPALTALRTAIRAAMHDYVARRAEFTTPAGLPDPPEHARLSCGTVTFTGPGSNGQHLHGPGYLSSVYHVAVPPPASADDPRGALQLGVCDGFVRDHTPCWGTRIIPAEPGWLTLFPSHIFHDVVPTGASEPRVSVISDLIPHRDWAPAGDEA